MSPALRFAIVDQPGDPKLDEIYEGYSAAFPLEEERVPLSSMRAALAKNTDSGLQSAIGPFRKLWIYAAKRQPDGSERVLGARSINLYAGSVGAGIDGTLHNVFTFVHPEARGQRLFDRLLEEQDRIAQGWVADTQGLSGPVTVLAFGEQNAPLKMTPRQYLDDIREGGMDPLIRRATFERRGYRRVNLEYTQPPAIEGGPSCDYLDLIVRGLPEDATLPGPAVAQHLERFYGLSFPQGTRLPPSLASALARDVTIADGDLHAPWVGALPAQVLDALPERLKDQPIGTLGEHLPNVHQMVTELTYGNHQRKTGTFQREHRMPNVQYPIETVLTKELDPAKFVKGVIDTPNHPDFHDIYACYLKCFTLPEEQETEKNFNKILRRNGNEKIKAIAGDAKEMWTYIKHPVEVELKHKDGTTEIVPRDIVVGASNFDAFAGNKTDGVDGTAHGIYMLVHPEYRQQKLFDVLIDDRQKAVENFIREAGGPDQPNIITFAEQNAPLRMTGHEYLEDTEAAIDQCKRREILRAEAFKRSISRYIQPKLSQKGEPCEYLEMVARGVPEGQESIPSGVIIEHLNRFFGLSFPRGTTVASEPEMEASLEREQIPLFPKGKFEKLGKDLNVASIRAMVPGLRQFPLSETFPDLVTKHYGKFAETMGMAANDNEKQLEVSERKFAAIEEGRRGFAQAPLSQDFAARLAQRAASPDELRR